MARRHFTITLVVALVAGNILARNGVTLTGANYDFGDVRYEDQLHKRFTIKNQSILPAKISSVVPACECTTVKLTDNKIPAFGKTYLDVTFNTRGFHGKATRFIDIEVSKPTRKNLTLSFDVDVKGGPEQGLEKILFSKPCSKCHVDPGREKSGKELYDAVCLMCHTENKAATPINRGMWPESFTKITREGIPGTNMPGYSKRHGGKLTEEQIESIERYFTNR